MRRRMVPRWPGILAVACLAGGSLVACEGGTLLEGDVLDAPPDVFIDRTATSTQVNAGTAIRVLVRADGRNSSGVESMDVSWTGAFNGSFRRVFEGAPQTVSLDTTISVPPTAAGTVTLKATASSPSGLKSDAAIAVVAILAPDTTPPEVSVASVLPARAEADDSIDVTIRCRDANEGGLLARCGYTVLFYQAGGDTVTVARSDTVMARDTALIHDVLPIQGFGTTDLPTDVTVEVHGFAVDAAGNCAANVREPFASLPCVAVGSRLLAEESAPANVTVVASTTIYRDWGGTIGDLVSDRGRGLLYASVTDRNEIEVLDYVGAPDHALKNEVLVGSQPFGITMDRTGDTLIVANSGGTSLSFVDLNHRVEKSRMETHDAVLYNVTEPIPDSLAMVTWTDRAIVLRPRGPGQGWSDLLLDHRRRADPDRGDVP